MLKEYLEQTVADWERAFGHPALLDRFILRNGKPFVAPSKNVRRGRAQQCFRNSSNYVISHDGAQYVEGYVMWPDIPIPILHAWVTLDGIHAKDPTMKDTGNCSYFGIIFDLETMMKEQMRNKCYGLLDQGLGLNHRFMFEIDPELRNVVEVIKQRRMKDAVTKFQKCL